MMKDVIWLYAMGYVIYLFHNRHLRVVTSSLEMEMIGSDMDHIKAL